MIHYGLEEDHHQEEEEEEDGSKNDFSTKHEDLTNQK